VTISAAAYSSKPLPCVTATATAATAVSSHADVLYESVSFIEHDVVTQKKSFASTAAYASINHHM
jgi:hypothetical protein